MAKTTVEVTVIKEETVKAERSWTIKINNASGKLAFFTRAQLMADGEEVLPSYWSGNYITLAPSESTTLTVTCPVQKLGTATPVLKVSGWNVAPNEFDLTK